MLLFLLLPYLFRITAFPVVLEMLGKLSRIYFFIFFFSHLNGWKYYEIFRELDTYFCGKLKEESKTGSVLYYVYIFYFKAVVETNRSLFQASGIGWCLVSTI